MAGQRAAPPGGPGPVVGREDAAEGHGLVHRETGRLEMYAIQDWMFTRPGDTCPPSEPLVQKGISGAAMTFAAVPCPCS